MIDIVFPKDNEKEFIKLAKKLKYSSLCFVYSLKEFQQKKEKTTAQNKSNQIKLKYGVLAKNNEIKKAQKLSNLIFVESSEKLRSLTEQNKNIILFDFEKENKKDFIHQRRSGLNHIICKITTKNKNKLALPLSSILTQQETKRGTLIGRIKANIRLCRKYKTNIIIASFATHPYGMRSYSDLVSFYSTLGLNPGDITSLD
jgi:RNase P/RNase MRP subunit p30